MKDGGLASLRKSLVTHYDRLKRRLSARLGNDELAGDALQDAYLKLDGVAAPEAVRQPEAYIYRMAFHIAADYARSGDERLTRAEADEILGLTPDAAPGPAQIAEDRQALHTLMRALGACRSASARSCWRHAWTASRKRSWRRGMAFRYAWWARAAARAGLLPRAPAVFKVGSMIFSRYFKSGAKALDSEAEAWVRRIQSGQPRGATRWRCGNGARTATRAAAFERARRAGWTSDRPAGRFAPRIRARRRRWRGPAAGCCCAGLAGAGAAAAAAALPPPLGWWASLEGLGADYSTAVGEQRTVDWGGGQAVVELDARTRMSVADGPRRLELLEGQAAITCAEQGQG